MKPKRAIATEQIHHPYQPPEGWAAMPVAVAKTAGAAAQKLGGRGSPAPAATPARHAAAKKKPAARRRTAAKPR